MTSTSATWDADLSMPIELPHAVKPLHLAFLRWLAVRDALEHAVAGPSSGEYAVSPASGGQR